MVRCGPVLATLGTTAVSRRLGTSAAFAGVRAMDRQRVLRSTSISAVNPNRQTRCGASGGAALTKADFQGSLSSTSLDGGSLMGQMAGMFGSNGQVSADQLQTVLKILAGQGTQPSQEAKSTASTPAGQDAIAKLG